MFNDNLEIRYYQKLRTYILIDVDNRLQIDFTKLEHLDFYVLKS